jgi:outer membrane protein assembly factor BamB
VYTLTQTDSKQYALCLDAGSGQVLWKQLLIPTGNHHAVNGPVSGPIIDGDRLYAFPYANLNHDIWQPHCPCFCLRASDGKIAWSEDKQFNCTEGSTPLIVGDTLYVGGAGKDCALAAVDKLSGKLRWKVAEDVDAGNKHVFAAASSLIYHQFGSVGQIVVSIFQNDVMGVDARSGRILWHWKIEHPTPSGLVPTPVAVGSRLFLSAFESGKGLSQLLELRKQEG